MNRFIILRDEIIHKLDQIYYEESFTAYSDLYLTNLIENLLLGQNDPTLIAELKKSFVNRSISWRADSFQYMLSKDKK